MFSTNLNSQDLEPRILSSLPVETNIAIAAYGYSKGDILLDPSVPIKNLNAKINSISPAFLRSFKLFNKLTKVDVVAPYSFAEINGFTNQIDTSTTKNGFGDPLLRISMNLIGSPPLKPSEFAKHEKEKFNFGFFFQSRIPLGKYDSNNSINLGANRWGFKTGVVGSYKIKK